MISDNLYHELDRLSSQIEDLEGSEDFEIREHGSGIAVTDRHNSLEFRLGRPTLLALNDGVKDQVQDFSFLHDAGILFNGFCEVCIDVINCRDPSIRGFITWSASELKFSVAEKHVNVGVASPLFVLLMEPIYADSDFFPPFDELTTIKIFGTDQNDAKNDIVKALYYLNSHYLKAIGHSATINTLDVDQNTLIEGGEFEESIHEVNRKRRRKRRDLVSVEPLVLYNHAKKCTGTEVFLYLYRVLEFFMRRAQLLRVRELRYDPTVDDDQLLGELRHRNERDQLAHLLRNALTTKQKARLVEYCHVKKLIGNNDFGAFANALYDYRNSIVHAKEQEIDRVHLPSLFETRADGMEWNRVADELAMRAIAKYNVSSVNRL